MTQHDDELPIELALELARFRRTVGELESLLPGDVIVTGQRVGSLAVVRSAGEAIAEGELVVVDDEVGVRITRVPQE